MMGFRFMDKHTFKDWNMTFAPGCYIGTPEKKKIKVPIAYSNHVWDFSEIYGSQVYEERPLTYKLNLMTKSVDKMRNLKVAITNWLMNSHGKQKLYDDRYPNYYFMAEVESKADISLDSVNAVITVEFIGYPFMIAELPEGNDIWDEFNFELDVMQETTFYPKRTTFKTLTIGETATVGAWSTNYDGGEGIPKDFLGHSYKITNVQPTDQHVSQLAYYLSGLNKWVIEQDVVQAQNGNIEVELYNSGSSAVTPTVITNKPITIIRGNEVFNIWAGNVKDDDFTLNIESNNFLLSGYNATVKFDFYKELI